VSAHLPRGWALSTLDEIRFDQSSGVDPSKFPDECFELYSVPSFEVGRPEIVVGREIGSSKQTVLPGTVLLCKINPRINRAWIVDDYTDRNKIASTEWIPFFLIKGLEPKFLCHFLSRHQMRDFLASRASGVGGSLMRVKPSTLEGYPIPIAPLPEQHRIVAEIEKHFTRLDASVAALKRARGNLKRYRAAVLKAACEGRLVPTEAELARAEGREYEPANVLLDRILRERRAKRGEPPAPDASGLPELPEGWVWASLGQVFQVFVGATPSRARSEYWNGDIPWVSSGEVSFCTIRDTRECISDLGLRNSSTELHPPGTVLLGMIGEGKTRGQAAILAIAACNNQNSAAIRVSEAGLPPGYIFRFLEGQYEQTRQIGSGNNQPALNKSRVQNIVFPLPPLAEQHRIVSEVERRLSLADELATIVEHSLKRADRLRQAILARAFEGRLVPQDPNDEPASVLLERIRAERAAQAHPRNDRRARRAPRKQRTRKTPDSPPARQTGAAA